MKHILLIAITLLSTQAMADALTIERERIAACANIESLVARVGCYDDLARGLLRTQDKHPTQVDQHEDEALFGRDESASRARLQEKLGIKEVDAIEARVAQVDRTPYGKLMLSLDNGQVWRQLDSARLPVDKGEMVSIQRAGLGSFLLEKSSGSRTIRVRRID